MPFKKGQSGNPGGRKKTPDDVREAAKRHVPEAIKVQTSIMRDPDAPPAARISAAENIINRAYGKPESTTNLSIGPAMAFIDLLRLVNERSDQTGALADRLDEQPLGPAPVRNGGLGPH